MPESREAAMRYWNRSVAWGRPFGAQSSILAQRRLQAHLVDCPVTQDSLARIARDPDRVMADVIGLNLRQAALSALGYYNGSIDGTYGAETRRAVRAFQRELGYDETASLTPRQTAQLMCHAAQTARDPSVQNVLGIMHAVGLGVVQNTDLALEWLEMAAVRGDPDANFNLAVIYGTGAVFGSYRLCAIVENPERADAICVTPPIWDTIWRADSARRPSWRGRRAPRPAGRGSGRRSRKKPVRRPVVGNGRWKSCATPCAPASPGRRRVSGRQCEPVTARSRGQDRCAN